MGWMGMVHARSYRQVPDRFPASGIRPRLVICADDVEARARDAQSRLGFEAHTCDWREVITHPDVDVVDICAPNHLHLEIVRAASVAGKHIACEKPVGRFPEETADAELAAREAGILTFTGYNYRWAPLVQYAKQLIQSRRLGDITHYRGRFFAGYASDPNSVRSWRFERAVAGLGALGDIMSHVVDMAHFLAGPIDRVISDSEIFVKKRPLTIHGSGTHFTTRPNAETGDVTNEDYASALVRFANGARGTFEVCRVISGIKAQMALEIHGTQGSLSWDFERMNELRVSLPENGEHDGYTRIFSGPSHPFHANFNPAPANSLSYEDLKAIEAAQFLESVAAGAQAEPGFRQALSVAEVLAAMTRSWELGTWEFVRPISRQQRKAKSAPY